MSLKDIRSECSDVASLLQPYVDGELSDDERKTVAEHLDDCEPCMAAVSEQLWVRSTLRALEAEPAPQSLRASILLGLDEVDREEAEHNETSTRPSFWQRVGVRARALMRGGMIMVPAGAVAGVLFLAARGGWKEAEYLPGTGLASALHGSDIATPPAPADKTERDVTKTLAEIEPRVGFPVQVVDHRSTPKIQLVGARVDDPASGATSPTAQLKYKVLEAGKDTGHHVIDHQRPARGASAPGTPVTFRGRRYVLGKASSGQPVVHFQRSGVAHMVSLEGGPRPQPSSDEDPDFSHLLDLADQLAQGSR